MPWRKLYESCIAETDPSKLKKLVFQLEDAIVFRYHDLICEPKVPNGRNSLRESDELQAIRGAAQQLRQLKIEKLGWLSPVAGAGQAILKPMRGSMAALLQNTLPATAPTSMQDAKQERPLAPVTRRTVGSRIEAALFATRRAWQNWVFKSLK